MADAMGQYEAREEEFGAEDMRQVERQVMLRVIDARWRDHLKELDHLRDGINLRALGQKDPLSEWQRESYDMFGSLMDTITKEYVQYVMHVQVTEQPERPTLRPQRLDYTAPAGPSESTGPGRPTPGDTAAAETPAAAGPALAEADEPQAAKAPVVRSEWEKTPRNAPCPCGSGKKYKQCHGTN
jgi:preprotein translocase subunit SecA